MFVADAIPPSLRQIIEFLNTQMVDTEVLGLEIEQFLSANGLTTLVPHLIGNTASAARTKRADSRKWDEPSFLEQSAQTSGSETAALCEKLLRAFESLGCCIWWGEGMVCGGFVPIYIGKQRHQLCSVYNWYKNSLVDLYFYCMKPPFNNTEYRMKLKTEFEKIPGVQIPNNRLDKRPSFLVNCLNTDENYARFIDTMKTYIEDIKACEAMQ